jgi:predicted NACHT family NTPase
VTDLGGLITTILGFGTAIAKDRLQRSELVIKLLKNLGLDPDHPPADFTAVYQYALVEYGVGKPKPVLDIFRQVEIQQIFRRALDQNNPAILLKEGEAFLAEHRLGDELQALGLNAQRELYGFAAVFLEIAKRTRTPAEVLTNQRLDSLHRQLGTMQERLNRLPTLEGIRTEMARLAEQGVPAASESSAAQQCRAFALAQQMRGWFETLGYRFEPTEVWADDYFEWILNIPVRRNRFDRILVRGIAGEAGLRDVLALGQSVAAQRTDEGWLVTARRISRAARDAVELPENRHLDCYTFDELVDLDADFSGYIAWLEAEILRRGVATQYVPLACAKEELDPVTKQRVTVSRYDERDGWIDGYCDRWLDDSTKEHISVLGEFGTGKTWFAFHYAQVALQRYQEAKERGTQRPRLPLVITLRDYAKALNVENVLAGFFFTQHNIRLNSEVFDQLNRMGKLLLIFDGFDEMAAKVDRQQMINNFWELAKVVVPGAKVILTCRTEHFPESQDGRALLNAELQASTANLTGETPQFEVLELEKFTDEQIRQVLAFQATAATVEQVMGNPQLLDLARRPVMTELILEALPDIEAGKPVDMSRVYLYAVRRKMERDIKAERTFTSLADKLYFMCELSWEMLSTDQMSLNYREFPDRIRKLFGAMVQEEKDLDHWHYDMMGQTMLIRNANGDYTPAHRSLLEFFVAYKFAAELGALAPDFLELAQMQANSDASIESKDYIWSDYFCCNTDERGEIVSVSPLREFISEPIEKLRQTIGQSPLSRAVIDLLLSMLHFTHLPTILESTRYKTDVEVGYISGNIATLMIKLNKASLEDRDLSHMVVQNAEFTNASLRRTNFEGAKIVDCVFTRILSNVLSVALSPDGKLLATADTSGAVCLWEITGGKEIFNLQGHSNWVSSVAFSPCGDAFASGSFDKTIKLWNTHDGGCLKVFQGHTNRIRSIAFSPRGALIASASSDKTVRLWDMTTGECVKIFLGHVDGVRSVSFSSQENLLASGSHDTTIRLWNILTGECLRILKGHTQHVCSVAFSPNGNILASGSDDQTIRLWDVQTGECINVLDNHTRMVSSLAFNTAGNLLFSSSSDKTVRVWNALTGECLKVFQDHAQGVSSIAFCHQKNIIASSSGTTVTIWSIDSGEYFNILEGQANSISEVIFSSSGELVASSSDDKTVRLWQISTGKCLQVMQEHDHWVNSVAFSPDNKLVASGSDDKTIKLWSIIHKKCLNIFHGHTSGINSVNFSPDGNSLVSGGFDHTVRLWNVETGECLRIINGHANSVWSTIFNPSGDMIASSSSDNTIRLWNRFTGESLRVLQGHTSRVYSIMFNPEGNLISSSSDGTVKLWDFFTGSCIKTSQKLAESINSVAFNSQGNLIAAGSDDKKIYLLDAFTFQTLKILEGHTNSVDSITFSPDGKTVASGGREGVIRLWNIEMGNCLNILKSDRPYEGMNITGVKGLTEAEKATLKALGAVEDPNV